MKDSYVAALLEDMNSKIDAIAEGVIGANEQIRQLKEQVQAIEQDTRIIPLIKVASSEDAKRIDNVELRVTRLERKTA